MSPVAVIIDQHTGWDVDVDVDVDADTALRMTAPPLTERRERSTSPRSVTAATIIPEKDADRRRLRSPARNDPSEEGDLRRCSSRQWRLSERSPSPSRRRHRHRRHNDDDDDNGDDDDDDDESIGKAKALASSLKEKSGRTHPKLGKIYSRIGKYHLRRGEYEAARAAYDAALDFYEALHSAASARGKWRLFGGRSRGDTVEASMALSAALGDVGSTLRMMGRADEAVRYLKRALRILEDAKGGSEGGCWSRKEDEEDDVKLARILYDLGLAKLAGGDRSGALRALRRARTTYESALRSTNLELAKVDDALGSAHSGCGTHRHNEQALERYKSALRIRGSTLEAHDPSVRRSLLNVADAHERLGRYQTAETYYRHAACAAKVALYMEPNPSLEFVRQVRRDCDSTHIMLERTRWRRGLARFHGALCTIKEEKEEKSDSAKGGIHPRQRERCL